jgi:phosphoketolase
VQSYKEDGTTTIPSDMVVLNNPEDRDGRWNLSS